MKIGFLAGSPQKSFDCLAEYAATLNHTVDHIPLPSLSLSYDGISDFAKECQRNFDVVHYYVGLADPIGQMFGTVSKQIGLPLLNNRSDIHPAIHDKMFQVLSFSQAGLPVPKTKFSRQPKLEELGKSLGYPVIAKRSRGTHGKHVHLVESQEQLDAFTQPSQYLFQEYLEHTNDVRVLVLNGKAVCGYRRYPKDGEFRANLAIGGHAEPLADQEEKNKVFQLAETAVEAIPLDLAGVDLIKSEMDGEYRLVEINVNPSWYGLTGLTDVRFEEKLIQAYQNLLV